MRQEQFFAEDDPECQPVAKGDSCTPVKLLKLWKRLGRSPTLEECKHEFGGILGALIDGWTLDREGRLPKRRKK